MSAASPAKPNKYYRAARWFGAAFIVSMLLIPLSLTLLTSTPPGSDCCNQTLGNGIYMGDEDPAPGPSPDPSPDGPTSDGPGPTVSQPPPPAPAPNSDNNSLALILSLGAFMVSGLGTASTVVLGWRSERRETAESRLRIEHLELQLAMARENVPQAEDPD